MQNSDLYVWVFLCIISWILNPEAYSVTLIQRLIAFDLSRMQKILNISVGIYNCLNCSKIVYSEIVFRVYYCCCDHEVAGSKQKKELSLPSCTFAEYLLLPFKWSRSRSFRNQTKPLSGFLLADIIFLINLISFFRIYLVLRSFGFIIHRDVLLNVYICDMQSELHQSLF